MDKIPLNERLIQPIQLAFKWLNHQNQIIHQDTGKLDHPIIGWLIPSYLDKTVLVYDHNGNEIKAIRALENGNTEIFLAVRDGSLEDSIIQLEREKHILPEFKQLLDNLNIDELLNLSSIIKEKLTKSAKIHTDNSMVSLLYGKPIAVAKASIGLKLLGKPAQNLNWDSTQQNDTGKIEDHIIKTHIGNTNAVDDGLVWYYLNGDYATHHQSGTLHLNPNGTEQHLTVLLAAGTRLHLDAGSYLPSKQVELMPHAVAELTKEIQVSYLICPLLTNAENSQIPIPSTSHTNWTWIHKTQVNTWGKPESIIENNGDEGSDFKPKHLIEGWVKINSQETQK